MNKTKKKKPKKKVNKIKHFLVKINEIDETLGRLIKKNIAY